MKATIDQIKELLQKAQELTETLMVEAKENKVNTELQLKDAEKHMGDKELFDMEAFKAAWLNNDEASSMVLEAERVEWELKCLLNRNIFKA